MRGSVSVCVLTPGARPPLMLTLWRALCLSGQFFTSLSCSLFSLLFPPLYLLSSCLCFLRVSFFPVSAGPTISSFCLGPPLLWCRIFITGADEMLDWQRWAGWIRMWGWMDGCRRREVCFQVCMWGEVGTVFGRSHYSSTRFSCWLFLRILSTGKSEQLSLSDEHVCRLVNVYFDRVKGSSVWFKSLVWVMFSLVSAACVDPASPTPDARCHLDPCGGLSQQSVSRRHIATP